MPLCSVYCTELTTDIFFSVTPTNLQTQDSLAREREDTNSYVLHVIQYITEVVHHCTCPIEKKKT